MDKVADKFGSRSKKKKKKKKKIRYDCFISRLGSVSTPGYSSNNY